jgi:TonB family protein
MWLRVVALGAWLGIAPALAEPTEASTLPVFVEGPAAIYPEEALDVGLEASVLLQLDVDATGRVVDAQVVEPAGSGFDQAAAQAALNFFFEPATSASGDPQSARILYRYVFTLERVPVLSAEGRVVGADSGDALFEATITAVGPNGDARLARTDVEGGFRFADLAPGPWTVSVTAPGYDAQVAEFAVAEGRITDLVLYPRETRSPAEDEFDEVVVVRALRVQPEITERVLAADTIRYLPGTNGDVVRAVQNLPGVGRPPLNIGQLLVRGTAPEDSGYYLDGGGLPIVFHFSGLSTVLNGDALEEVAFLPGNYGVRYGRTLGGVVDLRAKDTLPDRSWGYASVDVYQATAYAEQRLGDRTAVTLSGRRSYVDAILNPILNRGEASVQAPRYYDLQARVVHETSGAGTLDAMFLLSDDRFRVLGGQDVPDEDTVQIGLVTHFQKARLRWTANWGARWLAETSLVLGPEANEFKIAPEGEAYERAFAASFRHELYQPVQQHLGWRIGVDVLAKNERFLYDVSAFGEKEEGAATWLAPALYVEPTLALGPVRLVPGVRVDPLWMDNGYTTLAIDPRLAVTTQLGASTTLQASAGRYSQLPTLRAIVAEGERDAPLGPEVSWQTSLGVEQQISPSLSVEAVAYYNRLTKQIVGREGSFAFFTGPPPIGPFDTDAYANDGTGDIYGVEAQVKLETERAVGWIAATTGRSVRVKRPGDERRLFEYDQPVNVSALGSYQLPRRWRIGARARVSSGNPYTPVVNRLFRLDERAFAPVYGEPDSARLPPFFSLDVRVDKDWVFERWTLTAYLDLQNATNTANVEVMSWTADYSKEDPVTSIPILPAFGLRGEW